VIAADCTIVDDDICEGSFLFSEWLGGEDDGAHPTPIMPPHSTVRRFTGVKNLRDREHLCEPF